jgi:hypothetical protein
MQEYIYNNKTLLEQFKLFCSENSFTNFEQSVEFFAIFGGLNRNIDTSKSLDSQIQIHILKRYRYIRNDVSTISKGGELTHKILSGIAQGDRRTNSAFKKCKVSFDEGIDIIDEQCKLGMLNLEHSLQRFTNIPKDNTISEKLIFTTPFLRFWFTCISPVFKGVRDGDFKESMKIFDNKKTELITFVYEQLAFEVLKITYKDDEIKTIGRYWDNSSDIITLLAKTQSGKMIAGSIKYTNNKIKTTELNNLKTTCKSFGIEVDTFVLFSKKGFTSELKSLKSDSIKLFSLKNLNLLI